MREPLPGAALSSAPDVDRPVRDLGDEFNASLFDAFPEHCYLLARDRRILAVNRTAAEQLRVSPHELVGSVFHPQLIGSVPAVSRMLNDCERSGRSCRTEVRFSVPGARSILLMMRAASLPLRTETAAALVIGFDISRVGCQLRHSQTLALSDPLTQAYNRHFLTRLLQHESARSSRYGYRIGFIMADVDGLKRINDQYGHRAGDDALKLVARKAREALRASDVLVRYGGDEFLAVLPQTGPEVALVATRIQDRLTGASLQVRRQSVPVRVSVGTSFWTPDTSGRGLRDAIEDADRELYAAKRAGSVAEPADRSQSLR